MPDAQPVLYDRSFTFHPALSALLAVALGGGLIASLAPLLAGRPLEEEARVGLITGPVVIAVILFSTVGLLWKMRVTVTPVELTITWGYLGWLRNRFVLAEVQSYRPVTFSPMRDFGGWGWRIGRGGRRCYNTGGNKGVELTIAGRGYIVGTDDPEELVTAIRVATGRQPDIA